MTYTIHGSLYEPNSCEQLGWALQAPWKRLSGTSCLFRSTIVGLTGVALYLQRFSGRPTVWQQIVQLRPRTQLLLAALLAGLLSTPAIGHLLVEQGRKRNPAFAFSSRILGDLNSPHRQSYLLTSDFNLSRPGPLFEALEPILGPGRAAIVSSRFASAARSHVFLETLSNAQLISLANCQSQEVIQLFTGITELRLEGIVVADGEGVKGLVALLQRAKPTHLSLYDVVLPDPTHRKEVLAALKENPNLRTLDLNGSGFTASDVAEFVRDRPALTRIGGVGLKESEAATFAKSIIHGAKESDTLHVLLKVESEQAVRTLCENYLGLSLDDLQKIEGRDDSDRLLVMLAQRRPYQNARLLQFSLSGPELNNHELRLLIEKATRPFPGARENGEKWEPIFKMFTPS